ncbi:hypothetical protein ACRE_039260 [Hapsidospora chrysogenum ATCC 11550]|uniref:Uncharacterized protein n=1 Tax=Hapsidospora chrysogenum (strain ATCC 11550 / CBS 779.69 / DSM 880 / IAM 14645 / JCM 23072 / IMI 49137) TaxID=857340 RepID=A0A086T784_HAPC1|nr:hypothetical protein ACRE_039260 [Hapsidospora chrysogenum ATCC 11550]
MASLPAQHPDLSLHLTDSTLTPLITSSSSPSHLDSLTSLASTALTSHSAVTRVNLGAPQRIMVEYPDRGAVILQSYIDPLQHHHHRRRRRRHRYHQQEEEEEEEEDQQPSSPESRPLSPQSSSRPVSSRAGHYHPGHDSQPSSPTVAAPAATMDREDPPPRLVSVVVAGSADQTREARRAAARLERVGRAFQREWATDSLKANGDEVAA